MLSTELKSQIQGAYTRFLEAKGLKARYGQRLMIAEIAKVLGTIKTDDEGKRLGDPAVVAVEATTIDCASIILPITPPEEFAAAISTGDRPICCAVTFCNPPNSTLEAVSEPVSATPSQPSRVPKNG